MRDYLAEIAGTKSLARANHILSEMENDLSPIELMELKPRLETLPPGLRVQVALSLSFRHVEKVVPQPYRSVELHAGMRLFSDPAVPRAGKSLLVAFAGTSGRVMMPMSLFSQLLPASRFDILLLSDKDNASYSAG